MEQVIEISVDALGRIMIPPTLQSRLGLSPGMTLMVEKGGKDQIYLRIQTVPAMLVDKQGMVVVRAQPLSELTHISRQERDRRVFDLLERVNL
jgi:bifunctional DNA-binding transcriptional regulator/antitoxin component of YhaV-PrlF toxin-antitoxin module